MGFFSKLLGGEKPKPATEVAEAPKQEFAERSKEKGKERLDSIIEGASKLFSGFTKKLGTTFGRVREGANKALLTAIGAPEAGLEAARRGAAALDTKIESGAKAAEAVALEMAEGIGQVAEQVQIAVEEKIKQGKETVNTVTEGIEEAGDVVVGEVGKIAKGTVEGFESGVGELFEMGEKAYNAKKLELKMAIDRFGLALSLEANENQAVAEAAVRNKIDLTSKQGKDFLEGIVTSIEKGLNVGSAIGASLVEAAGIVSAEGKKGGEWLVQTTEQIGDGITEGVEELAAAAQKLRRETENKLVAQLEKGAAAADKFFSFIGKRIAKFDSWRNRSRMQSEEIKQLQASNAELHAKLDRLLNMQESTAGADVDMTDIRAKADAEVIES